MSRVSIPTSVRKMIQNLKEITGNHSEDEIYAALKECAMDPNEAANRLLSQDPFHEVRRKRDRKKENLNKEPAELRWKPGMQGRGNRGSRGNYSSRYTSHDAGTRNTLPVKENRGINQVANEGAMHSIYPTPQEKKNIETTKVASASPTVSDDPAGIVSENTSVIVAHSFVEGGGGGNPSEMPILTDVTKIDGPPQQAPPVETSKNPTVSLGMGGVHMPLMPSSSNKPAARTSTASTGAYLSASDPILMPSQDLRLPVGTIRREVGSQRTTVEQVPETSIEIKSTAYDGMTANSEVGSLFMQGNSPSEFHGVGKNQPLDSSRTTTHGGSSIGRPSSNYGSRSQQAIGPQKVGPSKEWKKKPTNPIIAQESGTIDSSEAPAIPVEAHTESHAMLQPAPNVLDSKDANFELERKREESHISDNQHVIIPDHIHVPEAEKLGFCFGSFDASFDFNTRGLNCPVSEKSPLISEASEVIEESVEEQPSSNQIELVAVDDSDFPERPPSSSNIPEDLSAEGDVSSSVVPDYSESKQEAALPAGHQYPVVHTSPNFSFGFMPPMLGNQISPFESSEPQARDGSRLPSFVVQQPFDPASYYAQFYRSGADSDGHVSPFHLPRVATKYNGNVTVVSPQASQSSQEVGNSLMLSTAGPSPLATQQAGVMQSSIAVTPQSLPVFRQPTGVHVPHYPPNYIPYAPYFTPFYVPSPTIHQFLSNGTFAQQPQATNIYPAPPVATSKYALSQYKPGANTGNSPHIGMPGSYGPYGSSASGYNPSPAATSGNSASNEELGGSQFKESNVYIAGQQSEGPGVWIAAPGRDISGLQASSFYNLPQAQVAFTPTQGGHGTFASIYHPAQPVTTGAVHPLQPSQTMAGVVDMVGPATSVYAQPQPAQMNWPNSY